MQTKSPAISNIPRATARLQFHRGFTLDDATALVGYYQSLGISHLYASPVLTARLGSTHGYDIADPTRVNPELGGDAALRRLAARLREAGMGLIIDIVPNHMSAGPENPWWQDVFEFGADSRYAAWFDIDWQSSDTALKGKILAPYLGQPYGEALRSGDLRLARDEAGGKLYIHYFSHRFPLAPYTYDDVLRGGDEADELARFSCVTEEGAAAMHELLERQHYRLTWWRNAAEEINWRRFFEVSDLAGVRVEDEEVFDAVHEHVFRLYAEGLIDGVRVDHVDGLADPAGYCRRLRTRLNALNEKRPAGVPNGEPWIVLEKILESHEELRPEWKADGTTGYEFMNQVGALLHQPAGEAPLTALWKKVTGEENSFENEVKSARAQLLAQNFVGELDSLSRYLLALARNDLKTRDFSLAAISRVLRELLLHFPVYRTYVVENGRDAVDELVFETAMAGARRGLRKADHVLLDVISGWLGGAAIDKQDEQARVLMWRALTKFQQLTPPLAAKSVEDTAFYRYGRLLSRNEVGADPGQFSLSLADFHAICQARLVRFPHTMLATATHDHKRGEDVRARLMVLAEIPQRWENTVLRWMSLNGLPGLKARPCPADELMLYQTLVGAWPLDLAADDSEGIRGFITRVGEWLTKAVREAKRHSDWAMPDQAYETACQDFLLKIFDERINRVFIDEVVGFVHEIALPGALNGLSQTLLRLTTPGVPDLYQGTELWDFSLVDPDNRRPVDFGVRDTMLAFCRDAVTQNGNNSLQIGNNAISQLSREWKNGAIKQAVVFLALQMRSRYPTLFDAAHHVPVPVVGGLADHVIAFVRHDAQQAMLVITLRYPATLGLGEGGSKEGSGSDVVGSFGVPAQGWGDTAVLLSGSAFDGLPAVVQQAMLAGLTDGLTGRRVIAEMADDSRRLPMQALLEVLPVGVFHTAE